MNLPSAKVTGFIGRSGSFEISVNDSLVYSKLMCGGYPKTKHVVSALQSIQRSEAPGKIKSEGCIIL